MKLRLVCLVLGISLFIASCAVENVTPLSPSTISIAEPTHLNEHIQVVNSAEAVDENVEGNPTSKEFDVADVQLNEPTPEDVNGGIALSNPNSDEAQVHVLQINLNSMGINAYSGDMRLGSPDMAWSGNDNQLAIFWAKQDFSDERPNGVYIVDTNREGEQRFACSFFDTSQELRVDSSLPMFWSGSGEHIIAHVRMRNDNPHSAGTVRIGLCDPNTNMWSVPLGSAGGSFLLDLQNESALLNFEGKRHLASSDFSVMQRLDAPIPFFTSKFVGDESTVAYLDPEDESIRIVNLDSPSNEVSIPTSWENFRLASHVFTVSPNGQFISWIVWNGNSASYRNDDKVKMMIHEVAENVTYMVDLLAGDEEISSGLWHPPAWAPDSTRFAVNVSGRLYISDVIVEFN